MTWTNLLKLTEFKKSPDLSSAHYSLDYSKAMKKYRQEDNINLQILSILIGDADVIMEFNSSLLFSTGNKRRKEELVNNFISTLKNHDINYRYRKLPYRSSPRGLFSFLMSQTNDVLHEVFAYIPNKLWNSSPFQQIVPEEGLRFYVIREKKNENLLDDIQNMMDSEKLESFDLIIFDNKNLATMGLNSIRLNSNDLRELLKI